jgi:branched-chain amino acid transport system substrate-binding protein
MDRTRRDIIKSIGAVTASTLAAPYLNLAHAQASPIPIGVALPLTGNAGAYGPDMAEAAKRTAAKINNAGGVLGGRKLELFIEDSESSAAVAANLSQKFINVHKAQALVGYWGTPEGMSSRPIAIQNKVVLTVSSAANAITEGDTQGYVWRFQMKATDWGIVIGRATLGLGFKTVGVMGLQNAFVLPIQKVFEEIMTKNGRKVVDSLIYNPEQPSYRAEVERIFGKKPDAVYCFGLLPDFVSIMKEVYRGGFDSKVVALSIMADAEGKFVQAVGDKVAEGIRHFQPMPDVNAPGYKRFLQLMGAPADRLFLFPPNTHDQIAIAALAMEKAKSPMAVDWSKQIIPVGNGPGQEVDDVAEALQLVRAGKAINFQGAGSTCDFTPNGDQLGRGMGQWIIKGGKSVFVEYAKP